MMKLLSRYSLYRKVLFRYEANDRNAADFDDVIVTLGYSESAAMTAPNPNIGYKFVGWSDGSESASRIDYYLGQDLTFKAIYEIDSAELPIMVIDTSDSLQITSKDEYIKCSVSVFNADEYSFDSCAGKIRGRGNSSWNMPKKSYKLKFDSKIDLFGNGKAKTWTLIANYCDPSLARNYLAYSIGAQFANIGKTTTKIKMVEVFLNGVYEGVYLVCEQNEVGETRVDIEDDFNIAHNPEDMGYLLEIDARVPNDGEEGYAYIVIDGLNYAIQSPDYEDLSDYDFEIDYARYVDYIKNYLTESLNALSSGAYDAVTEYIDVESFADAYIVHELFHVIDVGYSSFYMYKEENGKLFCGPIWDFDISSGNCDYNENGVNIEYLYARNANLWYNLLLSYSEFSDLVAQRLFQYMHTIKGVIDDSIEYFYDCKKALDRNFERWDILGVYVSPNSEEISKIETWQGQLEYLREWLYSELDFMLSVYNRSVCCGA